jgi:hypothetical protein
VNSDPVYLLPHIIMEQSPQFDMGARNFEPNTLDPAFDPPVGAMRSNQASAWNSRLDNYLYYFQIEVQWLTLRYP